MRKLFTLPLSTFRRLAVALCVGGAFLVSTFLVPSARAWEWAQRSYSFELRPSDSPDFILPPSSFFLSDAGPAWLMSAMPGSHFRARVLDRSGEIQAPTAEAPYVGTLHDVFDVNLFSNVSGFAMTSGSSKTSRPFVPDATLATKYWDTTAGAGNGVGGSATWSAQGDLLWSNANTGDATLTAAAATDAGIFEGTAGTITLGFSPTLASWTFNVTGYKITATDGTTRTTTGAISLANNVNLTIGNGETATRIIALAGSVNGGTGSGLTINATATGAALTRLNLASTGMTISVPITFSGTGFGAIAATNSGTISGTITGNGSRLNIGATGILTLSNTINNGTGTLQIASGQNGGSGTVTISSTGNTWGDTELNNSSTGSLRLGVTDALPTGTTLRFGTTSGNGNSTFDLRGFNQTIGQLTNGVQSGGTITNGASGTSTSKLTISGSDTTAAAFSGIIQDGSSTAKVSLERSGSGTTILSGANTYSGGTTISGGTLQVSGSGTLGATSGSLTVSGGNLDLNATSQTVGALNGTDTNASVIYNSNNTAVSTLTIGSGNATGGSYAGIITDHFVGSPGPTTDFGSGITKLVKTGTGTQTLTGTLSNYTGGTDINGGTLISNSATGGALGRGQVNVNNTGTLIGKGLIDAPVTVASGGTLAPGSTSTGNDVAKLTTGTISNGSVTLASGSNFVLNLNSGAGPTGAGAGTIYDQLSVFGTVTLGGGSLTLNLGSGLAVGDKFFIVLNDSTDLVSGTFNGLANLSTFTTGGQTFLINYNDFGDAGLTPNDISLTLVPEPSTWIGATLALGAVGYTQRRKLRRLIASRA